MHNRQRTVLRSLTGELIVHLDAVGLIALLDQMGQHGPRAATDRQDAAGGTNPTERKSWTMAAFRLANQKCLFWLRRSASKAGMSLMLKSGLASSEMLKTFRLANRDSGLSAKCAAGFMIRYSQDTGKSPLTVVSD